MKPVRVQLSRRKGWRKPDNTVVVARPSAWGNPFAVKDYGVERAVANYKDRIQGLLLIGAIDLSSLAGKNLACWCRIGEPCHADVLLEFANPKETTDAP